jgi:uncharacterized membrane protein
MNEVEFRSGVINPVECFKEAWEIVKDEYLLIFAITVVGLMIGGFVPIFLSGPMIAGIYFCLFQKIDGKGVKFEQLFKGFDYFLPSVVLMAIITIPFIIVLVGVYIPIIMASVSGASPEAIMSIMIGAFAVEVVFAFIMVCLHTLLMFSIPLIVDKKLSALESIKLSAKAVMANKGGVVGLFVVSFGVAIVGYLMLCVGIYLAIPLILAATTVAYRKVFPSPESPNFNPPPPNAYGNAGNYQ